MLFIISVCDHQQNHLIFMNRIKFWDICLLYWSTNKIFNVMFLFFCLSFFQSLWSVENLIHFQQYLWASGGTWFRISLWCRIILITHFKHCLSFFSFLDWLCFFISTILENLCRFHFYSKTFIALIMSSLQQ